MRIIGLTGGIGAGKSAVANLLKDLGAEVIDADREGHASYRPGSIGWGRIVSFFGADILNAEGEVDRKLLSGIVFGNPDALALLSALTHPLIRERMERRLQELREEGVPVVVIDAAVLYQAGWDDLVDEVWAVTAPESVVVPRLEARGLSNWDARRRIVMQDGLETANSRAAAVITNTGTLEDLQKQVETLWNERISLLRQ
ncbi:MAG: dephospho-CoA kinase [Dehalococcoidia bacterium]